MNITVAKHAGFCFGVERAVTMAETAAKEQTPVYTLGEIIHNGSVVASLREKGVYPVENIDELARNAPGRLIIRSHGAPPEVFFNAAQRSINVIDATCPFVKRIHEIVSAQARAGRHIYIAGKSNHPEVEGIRGWAKEHVTVLEDVQATAALSYDLAPSCIVAQTTLRPDIYADIYRSLSLHCTDLTVHNTICDTTVERQAEAEELSKNCTKMIVIGGHHSSNTRKLYEVCQKHCKHTQSIDNCGELLLEKIHSNDIIGIVAGASTPQWMIREVVTVMNELGKTTVDNTEAEVQPAPAEAVIAEASEAVAPEAAPEVEAVEAEQENAPAEVPALEEAETAVAEPTDAQDKDDDAQEADASKESFAEAFEKTMVRIRNGQIITGSVVQIADGEVCVNIGFKSDGFIPKSEFSSDPDVNPADVVKVGDPIEVEVIKVNDGEGNVLLSRKSVEGKKLWEELMEEAETPDKIFEAIGKDVVKGGLIATINGVRAFVPASHVSTKYVENLSDFVGKPMKLQIIEVDKSRKRIVASQKNVLLAEMEAEKKQKWSTLEVGSKIEGTVRRLTDFGAFVDIGGVDGLVHVTDVAWGRVKHPSDILKIGQQIEVLVLNVDAEKERVSLGYKQLQPKPWTMAGEKYPVGSIVEGKVVRIVPFGAFVALEPTIDGLIHISQVSVKRIAKVEDEINVGDVVRCKVLDVNSEAKRISLSRKEVILEENPEIAEQLAAERAERDRQYAERQEQRSVERQQRVARTTTSGDRPQQPARSDFPSSAPSQERSERRPRRTEGGDYDLPPVQSTTTSLADLFQGLNMDDLPEGEE
ncbi:bifunctional 4-hydroxy-3-methylbut-2-enyl diphosphate reductase/30S ribosomal protein S1 [Christensenellaceae bacterium OttesenSCG-928-M15]|nr:bifunctional 4-hydroxy-3-methylbut-2-enyl diphosphate reductase/30S ribosomal protein S1 [Christensenellaceae bacterium OttesenSCG-928-M15]